MYNLIAPTILLLWASSTAVIAAPLSTHTDKLTARYIDGPSPTLPCPKGIICGSGPECTDHTPPGCTAELKIREAAGDDDDPAPPCPLTCNPEGLCSCIPGTSQTPPPREA